jgi:hypothetical protein
MRIPGFLALAMVGFLCPALAQQANGPPKGMTIIDGSKTPEAIPEYVIWRHVFRMLGRPDDTTPSIIPRTIGVARDQLDLIIQTAQRSAAAEATNRDRQERALKDMHAQGLDPDKEHKQITQALFEIDYEQRVSTLQERDALLEKLTPEARDLFQAWVSERRRKLSTWVPTAELEQYYQPK